MAIDTPIPCDMVAIEHFRLESTEGVAVIVEQGTFVRGVDAETAVILAGSGKARVATPEEVVAANTPRAAAKKADDQ